MSRHAAYWLIAVAAAFFVGLSMPNKQGAPANSSTSKAVPVAVAAPVSQRALVPGAPPLPRPAASSHDDTVIGDLLKKKEPLVWENPQTAVGISIPALLQPVGGTQRVGSSSQWLFVNMANDGWVLLKDNVVSAAIDDPKKAIAKYFATLTEGGVHYIEAGKWRTVTVQNKAIQTFAARAGRVQDEPLMFDTYMWRSPNGLYWALIVRDPEATAYGSMTDGLLGQFVASTVNFDSSTEAPLPATTETNQSHPGGSESPPTAPEGRPTVQPTTASSTSAPQSP